MIGLSVIRNLCKICTSSIYIKFSTAVDVFQVLCNDAPIHIKKLAYLLLGQPNIAILDSDLYAVFFGVICKNKEVNGAVPNLMLLFIFVTNVMLVIFTLVAQLLYKVLLY